MTETIEIIREVSEQRYWIKAGMTVRLRGMDLSVTVDKIVYKTFDIPDGMGHSRKEKRVMGVQCHWVDKEHKYQRGMFHTRELEKP